MGLITDEVLVRFFVDLMTTGTTVDPNDVELGLATLCNNWPSDSRTPGSLTYALAAKRPHEARSSIARRYPELVEAFDAAEIVIALQAGDVNG